MRKWIGLIMVVVMSSGSIRAEEVKQSTDGIVDEWIQSEEVTPYLSRQLFHTILEEQHLAYLIDQPSKKEITLKEAAYALCQMINESGAYLPESEGVSDPYIGKLVLLGIWQESEVKEESLITSEAWDRTYGRVLFYQEYRQALTQADSNKEKKMMNYRQKMKTISSFEEIKIGKLIPSNQVVAYGTYTYPLYTFLDTSYIDLKTLEALGFNLEKQAQGDVLSFNPERTQAAQSLQEKSIEISLANSTIYYGALKTYTLQSKETLFIPLRALEIEFDLKYNGGIWYLEIPVGRKSYLAYRDGLLYNTGAESIEVTTTSYYWNGQETIEETKKQYLEPNQSIEDPRSYYVLRGATYLNTIINEVKIDERSENNQKLYGQQIDNLLKSYEQARLDELKKQEVLFPAAPVYATLKVATKGLKKGEQVELYREDNGSYTVITKDNKKITIPKKDLNIPADKKVTALPASKVQIETYINEQNIESVTNYLVWTDLYRQTTYVLKGRKNEWELIKRMTCSTGKNETPTPRGFFTLQNKVPSFGQEKGYACKNAYGFIGSSYLYHSILFDKTGSYIIAGKKELGQKASHGCIRLMPEDSLWLYNTMPKGTKVWIN